MKKQTTSIAIFAVISTVFLFACSKDKKYEKWIVGEKRITQYLVDGVDSLQFWNSLCNDGTYTFKELREEYNLLYTCYSSSPPSINIKVGDWKVSADEKIISFTGSSQVLRRGNWNIFKINSSELEIGRENNGKYYQLFFTEIN